MIFSQRARLGWAWKACRSGPDRGRVINRALRAKSAYKQGYFQPRIKDNEAFGFLGKAKRSGCYCAVMYVDLDEFKPLNDTHGHETGDLLLVEVARRLAGCVRETDTVARFGGDEFVVLIADLDVDKEHATQQAQRIAEKSVRHWLPRMCWLPMRMTLWRHGSSAFAPQALV
jgi:hypothetical protein